MIMLAWHGSGYTSYSVCGIFSAFSADTSTATSFYPSTRSFICFSLIFFSI
jgi:hypothetical protein